MSGRDRVFVDANELFPFSVMDLVLSLAEDMLIDFVWTDELLDEWERVIVREGKRTPETARSVSATIRRFFVTTQIEPTTYRDRVQDVPGRDPDDRVHAAACAFGGATVGLTRNRRDFPGDFLTEHGVTVSSADDYLTGLLRRRPMAFLDVVGRLASEKQRPPVAPCDLAAGLGRGGAPRLSASLRRRLGSSDDDAKNGSAILMASKAVAVGSGPSGHPDGWTTGFSASGVRCPWIAATAGRVRLASHPLCPETGHHVGHGTHGSAPSNATRNPLVVDPIRHGRPGRSDPTLIRHQNEAHRQQWPSMEGDRLAGKAI